MTTIEFSDYMDATLSQKGITLDDFEKSYLLSFVQEQVVEDLCNNNIAGFEETEKRRRSLSNLILSFEAYREEKDLPNLPNTDGNNEVRKDFTHYISDNRVYNYHIPDNVSNATIKTTTLTKENKSFRKIKSDSSVVTLPENLLYIVYEQVTFKDKNLECLDGNTAVVTPITHDEYYRAMQDPFRRPNERRVFRFDVAHPENNTEVLSRVMAQYNAYKNKTQQQFYEQGDAEVINTLNSFNLRSDDRPQMIELISKYKINTYLCRYVKKPNPIIVNDLPEYLSVFGFNRRTESETAPMLHKLIADTAIKLALQYR